MARKVGPPVLVGVRGGGVEESASVDAEGEHFVVDNRFVIAFSDTVTYQFVKATKRLKDSLLSGEGFVNRYTGPGRLYYQARSKPSSGYLSRILDASF